MLSHTFKHLKQKLTKLKREDRSIQPPLSIIGKEKKGKKISKDIEDLKNTFKKPPLIGIYTTLHPTIIEYTFFINAYGSYTKIGHVGH